MKVNSKIGDSYRVIIPKEIRDILNIEKYQPITLEVDDLGRIIIDLKCGRTETGLVKNTLNIESLPKGARYWENGVLKVKLDDLLKKVNDIDADDVKKEFDTKVAEIKTELADLDKEKAMDLAKEKGKDLKKQAEELVKLAKEKGTPVLKESAEDVLETVIKASKEVLKKLDTKEK